MVLSNCELSASVFPYAKFPHVNNNAKQNIKTKKYLKWTISIPQKIVVVTQNCKTKDKPTLRLIKDCNHEQANCQHSAARNLQNIRHSSKLYAFFVYSFVPTSVSYYQIEKKIVQF